MNRFDPTRAHRLSRAFFERPTALVARELLGKVLASTAGGVLTAGIIVEAEAYLGADDPGSHASTRGITARNRVMYGAPGCAYVYFTYGNHHMLNLVTEAEGIAGAVLVRAVEPVAGIDTMLQRRHGRGGFELVNGPGKVAEAFGVGLQHNGAPLGGELALYDAPGPGDDAVGVGGRIGLSAGHDLPLRFYMRDNGYVSHGRMGPKGRKPPSSASSEERA